MRLSILLLFVFLLSCSSNSTEIIPPEMEESNVRVFEESANFISQDQNAGLPEDRFREIVFMMWSYLTLFSNFHLKLKMNFSDIL